MDSRLNPFQDKMEKTLNYSKYTKHMYKMNQI